MFEGLRAKFNSPSKDQSKDELKLKAEHSGNANVDPGETQEVRVEALGLSSAGQAGEVEVVTAESVKQEIENAGSDIKITPGSELADTPEVPVSVV